MDAKQQQKIPIATRWNESMSCFNDIEALLRKDRSQNSEGTTCVLFPNKKTQIHLH